MGRARLWLYLITHTCFAVTLLRGREHCNENQNRCVNMRVFTIYQILLGRKTYKYYYETDQTSQPKANPTQEKIGLNVAKWATFSHSKYFLVGWAWFLVPVGNSLQETQPNHSLDKQPIGMRYLWGSRDSSSLPLCFWERRKCPSFKRTI